MWIEFTIYILDNFITMFAVAKNAGKCDWFHEWKNDNMLSTSRVLVLISRTTVFFFCQIATSRPKWTLNEFPTNMTFKNALNELSTSYGLSTVVNNDAQTSNCDWCRRDCVIYFVNAPDRHKQIKCRTAKYNQHKKWYFKILISIWTCLLACNKA